MDKRSGEVSFLEPRVMLGLVTAVLVGLVLFYCVVAMITTVGYQTFVRNEQENAVQVDANASVLTIILDAGHGGEDPGAVDNNLREKDLNLAITQRLAEYLALSDCRVVLTRSDDRLLYNNGEESRKKYYDLHNRLKIAESYPNAVFISIHMNKFPLATCKGLQIFYSENHSESRTLAEQLQQASHILQPNNQRLIKSDNKKIFLLKYLQMPAVLIECGFLSNPEEALALSDEAYQDQLAFSLYCGISAYLEGKEDTGIENELYLQ